MLRLGQNSGWVAIKMYAVVRMLKLLPSNRRGQFRFVLFISILAAVLDLFGVASIMPFIQLISDSSAFRGSVVGVFFISITGVEDSSDLTVLIGACSISFLILSAIIRAFSNYSLLKFVYETECELSASLLNINLNKSLLDLGQRKSGEIGKNILAETGVVAINSLLPFMNILSQIFTLAIIVVFLLITNLNATLAIGSIFILSYALIYFSLEKSAATLGAQRRAANQDRFSVIGEAFQSVRETKIYALDSYLIKRFKIAASKYADAQTKVRATSQTPRYLVEGVTFSGIILSTLVLGINEQDFASYAPTVGLFAFAGYKLLPAFQQIYAAVISLKYSESSVEEFIGQLLDARHEFMIQTGGGVVRQAASKHSSGNVIVSVKDCDFAFSKGGELVIKGASLDIRVGERIGIVGLSGSGKSTLLDLVAGLYEPDNGSVIRNGLSNCEIAYVPQEFLMLDENVASNLLLGMPCGGGEQMKSALEKAALLEALERRSANCLEFEIGENGSRLSGGQKQRLALARALYRRPKLILLDEATSALDTLTENMIDQTLSAISGSAACVIVAHRMTTVARCDRIYVMDQGRIIDSGPYEYLLKNNDFFGQLNGTFKD